MWLHRQPTTSRKGQRDEIIYVPRWGAAAILQPTQWPTNPDAVIMPEETHAYVAEVMVVMLRRWLGLEGPPPPPPTTTASGSGHLQVCFIKPMSMGLSITRCFGGQGP